MPVTTPFSGKVLFVTMALPTAQGAAQVGGSAKSPIRLLRWLAPLTAGVHVIAGEGRSDCLPQHCSGTVVRLPLAHLFLRPVLQGLAIGLHLALHGGHYAVVQSHHPHLSAGVALVRKLGIWRGLFILKAHGTALPEFKTNDHRGLRALLLRINAAILRWNDAFALRHASAVVCSSRFQMAEMREIYGVPDAHLAVIYNGFDPEIRARSLAPPPVRSRRMVFCGRVVRKKNAVYAITLYRRLRELGLVDGLDLILGHRDRIESSASYSGILSAIAGDAAITVHHDLSEHDLYQLFAGARLGVVPSVGYESIPSVIYELAACGTPVFATGRWGIAEVLPERYHLSLDLDADAGRIAAALASATEDHCGWVEPYRYDRVAARYLDLYRRSNSA